MKKRDFHNVLEFSPELKKNLGLSITLEDIRYYFCVSCLVLGCCGLPTAVIILCLTEVVPLEGQHLYIVYSVTYVTLAFFGLRFYIPRLRGLT